MTMPGMKQKYTLRVQPLAPDSTELDVRTLFNRYGGVKNVTVVRGKQGEGSPPGSPSKAKCYGLVEMIDFESAETAVTHFSGIGGLLQRHKIKVDWEGVPPERPEA
eukprot:TRINITY_DN66877_c1_g1_i1.p2 TRINITY_DN66877_c1_g1~~TRINITY_DN66877_c1_g1_i1.p2  ORF type:complete len:106 (-),score=6.88 TRINITY_DN66877_c1_g1_i1:271-588(-)